MRASPNLTTLEHRRRALGMTFSTLAIRSGVSLPTVQRICSGRHRAASFENIAVIAQALGLTIDFTPIASPQELRETQAKARARELVALVQGTSALEGQAIDPDAREQLVRQTTHELLAGSPRKLWQP